MRSARGSLREGHQRVLEGLGDLVPRVVRSGHVNDDNFSARDSNFCYVSPGR